MRELVAVELVSLDGVMGSPEEWTFFYSNDEIEANAAGMASTDAMLLGGGPTRGWPPSGPANLVARRWWTT